MKLHGKDIMQKLKSVVLGFSGKNEKKFFFMILCAIIVLVNIALQTVNVRFDLTKNNTYSLTEESKKVVSSLKENLTIIMIFSRDLSPENKKISQYVKDLLAEYENYGNQYFSFKIIDKDNVDLEAENYSIPKVQNLEVSNDSVKSSGVHMGLVFQHGDLLERIGHVNTTSGLEFLITSKIKRLTSKINSLLALDKPIKATLYIHKDLKKLFEPNINTIKDVFKKNSKNYFDKLSFRVVDDYTPEEGIRLESEYGIAKLSWKELRTFDGKVIPAGEGHLGILFDNMGKYVTIRLNATATGIVGLEALEENIDSAVSALLNSNQKVGYITGHGEPDLNDQRDPGSGAFLNMVLSDLYQLRPLDLTKEEIPGDIHTVIINGPKKQLTELELYKIDQHLMAGKAVLIFVDPYNEVQIGGQQFQFQQQQPLFLPVQSGLEQLLKSYGINISNNYVLDEQAFENPNADKPLYLLPIVNQNGLNQESEMTQYLNGLALYKVAAITYDKKYTKEKNIKADVLVKTSPKSWMIDGRVDIQRIMAPPPEAEKMKQHTVALSLTGSLESYFKDKDINSNDRNNKIASRKLLQTVKTGASRIVVVGSSEITRSQFLMQSSRILSRVRVPGGSEEASPNVHFLHNIVDVLNGNLHVPEMRSKSMTFNPLEETSDRFRIIVKVVNIVIVPTIVILLGILLWNLNMVRRRRIMREYSSEVKNG